MEYLKQKKIRVELTTNGTVFNRYDDETILNWELDHIGVSVDGLDEESYNTIRRNGDYNKFQLKIFI